MLSGSTFNAVVSVHGVMCIENDQDANGVILQEHLEAENLTSIWFVALNSDAYSLYTFSARAKNSCRAFLSVQSLR